MKFCQKCHKKTEMSSGRVRVQIETTTMEAESPIYICRNCGISGATIQINVIPNEKLEPKKEETVPEGVRVQ